MYCLLPACVASAYFIMHSRRWEFLVSFHHLSDFYSVFWQITLPRRASTPVVDRVSVLKQALSCLVLEECRRTGGGGGGIQM